MAGPTKEQLAGELAKRIQELEKALVEFRAQVIQREGFGQDSTPDLLYLNYKAIDTIGHIFSADSPEMQQTLRAQDAALPVLIDALNRLVGACDLHVCRVALLQ